MLLNADSSEPSSSSSVLPQTSTGSAPDWLRLWLRLATMGGAVGGATSNFRLPDTEMRDSGAPISISLRRSSSVCARNRSTLSSTFGSQKRKRLYPASERSEIRQLITAMRAPLRFASLRKFGQNSVSATTTSSGQRRSEE